MSSSRMKNPAFALPEAMQALYALSGAAQNTGISERTLRLIEVRASQLNGCSVCVDMHSRQLRKMGETDERLFTIAAWHDTPYFTEAERAALALTEALTRLDHGAESVSDAVWQEAAKHYDERQLAGLLVAIGNINVWNRLNIAIRHESGDWVANV